jgi:hypothetical protein
MARRRHPTWMMPLASPRGTVVLVAENGIERLYVVRHALAGRADPERWPDDAKRPLTAEGSEQLQLGLKKRGAALLGVDGPVEPGAADLRWVITPKILRALQAEEAPLEAG